MDKQKLIASLGETAAEQLLLARLYDRLAAGDKRSIPAATCFLTGREQLLAKELLNRTGLPNVHFFGGSDEAERRVACYVPEYYEPEEYLMGEESPVAALRAEISAYDSLSHRDFLGGILAQGVKREILGDIYVQERQCDFLVLREMAPYLMDNLKRVGRATITLRAIGLRELQIPPQKTKQLRDTVASLRLDSILASGFQMGRGKAQDYISAGRVEVNHMPALKADKELREGDILSVRGLGKLQVTEVKGLTKKGRTAVTLHRFL